MIGWTNEFNYGLSVSTNYINPYGFVSGDNNPTNVNFDFKANRLRFSALDWEQNIANLLYDPRPPVFITNALFANSNEFRFYLDLNRNGRDDPSGLQPVINPLGGYYDLTGKEIAQPEEGNTLSNYFVGDPEWIGVLRYPEFGCSADNPFISRYAYIAVPVGQTLDINNIYNDAKHQDLSRPSDGFLRNQGALTAEINLAAFLADLNTNFWYVGNNYNYNPYTAADNPFPGPNTGHAFDDAAALLGYRYGGRWNSLASAGLLFTNGPSTFQGDFIDDYSGGPVMLGTAWPAGLGDPDSYNSRVNLSWPGAPNPNRFYTTQDLFDQSKTRPSQLGPNIPSFSDRLVAAGNQLDSYDRNTFYRLLSQLGTDSAPEPGGKMNLNYRNVDDNGYVVPNMETNFIPWQPALFFTNAAIRLLANAGYAPGNANYAASVLVTNYVGGVLVTNLHIQVWPTNYYTPSVNRLLQLAANMYDATTNRLDYVVGNDTAYLPTVFRPEFSDKNGNNPIFIVGYHEVTPAETYNLVSKYDNVRDLSEPGDFAAFDSRASDMVYGIPLIIGAKKGLPNFNEFAMQTTVQVTRKLQFHRPGTSTTAPVNEIDEMYILGISNVLGAEAWNSYGTPFSNDVQVVAWPDVSVVITNADDGTWLNPPPLIQRYRLPSQVPMDIPAHTWSRFDPSFPQYLFSDSNDDQLGVSPKQHIFAGG